MQTKLNKTEQRAKDYCNHIRGRGEGSFTIEWKKSRTWGMNPTIQNYSDERMVSVSGCGYCKHSTALAEMLRFLGASEEDTSAIWAKGGCGVDSVVEALHQQGWHLKSVHWTKTSDTYTITRRQ